MNNFEQIVSLEPAYDKRDPDPKKNYGIHGVNLRMVLKGPLGATQFLLFTNWQLPKVTADTDARILAKTPSALDALEYCDGGECYYDGSGLNAYRIYEVLLREGSKGVWRELREFYDELAKEEIVS